MAEKYVDEMSVDELHAEVLRLIGRTYTPGEYDVRIFRREEIERLIEVFGELNERLEDGHVLPVAWVNSFAGERPLR